MNYRNPNLGEIYVEVIAYAMKPQFAESKIMAVLFSFFLFEIKILLNLGARKVWCCRKYVSCNKYAKVNDNELL